jgi:hypothetical protein
MRLRRHHDPGDYWNKPRKIGNLQTSLHELELQTRNHLDLPNLTPWEEGLARSVLYLLDELRHQVSNHGSE